METDWHTSAAAWDEGCRKDEVRNNIVIPHLDSLLEGSKFWSVIDVGCGTGYITRQLASKYVTRKIQWILLDANEEMLRFAAATLDPQLSTQIVKADITNQEDMQSIYPAGFAFAVFATLEFRMTKRIAQNIAGLIVAGGTLVIFLPDVLRDVINVGTQREERLLEYVNGYCELQKIDKFTQQPYPFHASRIEMVIADFLNAGLQLLRLKIYQRNDGHRQDLVFGLDFKKESSSDAS